MSVNSLFRQTVIWTQICNMNTRYTLYEMNKLSKDTSKILTIIVIPGFNYFN